MDYHNNFDDDIEVLDLGINNDKKTNNMAYSNTNNKILDEDTIIQKKHRTSFLFRKIIRKIDDDEKYEIRKIRKRIKLKSSFKKAFLVVFLLGLIIISTIGVNNYLKNKRKEELLANREEKYNQIVNNYSDYVITTGESDIYTLDNDEYKSIIKVNNGVKLYLDDTVDDYNDEYFKIKDTDYYINYANVKKIDEFTINQRYKSFIVFNQNVVTNDSFYLYDSEGKYLFNLTEKHSFPIWIKDDDGYYVEFMDQLMFIKKDDVKELVKENNTTAKTTNKVKTFCYHQIYKEGEKCNSTVYTCIPYKNFESHLKYLQDNNYLTLSMSELELFLDKKIQIPKKTVVITLDDGARNYNAAELAEKYESYMTYFIITGTYDTTKLIDNPYIEYQSHTDSLHKNYRCTGGNQGGLLLCEKESTILKDLALSQEKLGGKDKVFAFAYPFYDYNDRAIKLLKKQGFRLGFIGLGGTDGYTTQGTDKMKIRRRTVWGNHSLNDFIKFVTT